MAEVASLVNHSRQASWPKPRERARRTSSFQRRTPNAVAAGVRIPIAGRKERKCMGIEPMHATSQRATTYDNRPIHLAQNPAHFRTKRPISRPTCKQSSRRGQRCLRRAAMPFCRSSSRMTQRLVADARGSPTSPEFDPDPRPRRVPSRRMSVSDLMPAWMLNWVVSFFSPVCPATIIAHT